MDKDRPFHSEPSCTRMHKEAYYLFENITIFEDALPLKEMLR